MGPRAPGFPQSGHLGAGVFENRPLPERRRRKVPSSVGTAACADKLSCAMPTDRFGSRLGRLTRLPAEPSIGSRGSSAPGTIATRRSRTSNSYEELEAVCPSPSSKRKQLRDHYSDVSLCREPVLAGSRRTALCVMGLLGAIGLAACRTPPAVGPEELWVRQVSPEAHIEVFVDPYSERPYGAYLIGYEQADGVLFYALRVRTPARAPTVKWRDEDVVAYARSVERVSIPSGDYAKFTLQGGLDATGRVRSAAEKLRDWWNDRNK